MDKLLKKAKAFLKDEEGLTTVEYAVAGALIAAATVTAFENLGDRVCEVIDTLSGDIGGTTGAC